MISVCIPVFNADVRKLADSLIAQAGRIPSEIILIDDGSDAAFREMNRELKDKGVRYFELGENIGRSRIRNRFTGHAIYKYLLFLDCDSVLPSAQFLENYAEALARFPDHVICGGRIYLAEPPDHSRSLHWKYGIRKESQPVQVRRKDPNRSFMTNNFLLPMKVLKEIPFDERLSGYGHEDSLFGHELGKKGYEIIHIDNPVVHGELELNGAFLDKTREAVQNLVSITGMLNGDPGFTGSISLLQTVSRLESTGLKGIVRMASYLSVPLSEWLLRRGLISLKLLDVFKLGLYLRLKKQSET